MRRLHALLLVVAATVVWGATFTVVKAALDDSGPLTFLALRFLLASACVMAIAGGVRNLAPTPWSLVCGAALFGGYVLQTVGLTTTTPARSAFITAIATLLVPAVEPLLGVNRFSVRVVVGGGLALVGLGVLLRPEAGSVAVGDILTLGCAVAFAAHIVALHMAVRQVPATRVNAVQVLVAGVLALPAASVEGWRCTFTPRLGVALLVTAVLATVAAFWAVTAAQETLSAAETSVILAFEPVAAAVVSTVLGSDALTPSLVGGGSLVVAGVVLATARTTGTVRPAPPRVS